MLTWSWYLARNPTKKPFCICKAKNNEGRIQTLSSSAHGLVEKSMSKTCTATFNTIVQRDQSI